MPLAFFVPGPMEMVILAIVAVLLFGSKLPKVARSLGSAIPEFRKGLNDVKEPFQEAKGALDDAARTVNKTLQS